jgi:hypothetical protein
MSLGSYLNSVVVHSQHNFIKYKLLKVKHQKPRKYVEYRYIDISILPRTSEWIFNIRSGTFPLFRLPSSLEWLNVQIIGRRKPFLSAVLETCSCHLVFALFDVSITVYFLLAAEWSSKEFIRVLYCLEAEGVNIPSTLCDKLAGRFRNNTHQGGDPRVPAHSEMRSSNEVFNYDEPAK